MKMHLDTDDELDRDLMELSPKPLEVVGQMYFLEQIHVLTKSRLDRKYDQSSLLN
jgi:hypothetical protein